VTTMVWGRERFGYTGQSETRWRATMLHGGVLAALATGLLALWTVVALVAALLAHPVPTMTTLEREGARGVPKVVRAGTATVLDQLRGRADVEAAR
jgi:hypothetical protein